MPEIRADEWIFPCLLMTNCPSDYLDSLSEEDLIVFILRVLEIIDAMRDVFGKYGVTIDKGSQL